MSTKDTRSYRLLSNVNPLIFFILLTWDEVLCYVSHAFTLFLCHPFCCLPWTSSTSASPPCPPSDPTSNPPSLPQKLSVLQIYSFLTPLPFCIYVVRFLELIKGRVFFPLTTWKKSQTVDHWTQHRENKDEILHMAIFPHKIAISENCHMVLACGNFPV